MVDIDKLKKRLNLERSPKSRTTIIGLRDLSSVIARLELAEKALSFKCGCRHNMLSMDCGNYLAARLAWLQAVDERKENAIQR